MGLKPIKTRRVSLGARKEEEEEEEEAVEEPLSPGSRLFLTPQMNCCIIAVAGCKTKINADVIKEGIKHTFIKHPRFSSKLVFDGKKGGKPVGWVRTKVNLDNHITVPDLDPNIDSPDEFVEEYVSNFAKIPMDLSKPLWDLHLLNIETSHAKAIGVLKIHHSIGDGVSLISYVLACTRQSLDPEALPTLPIAKKKKTKLPTNSYPWFLRWFLLSLLIFKLLWNTLVDLSLFIATVFFLKDTNTSVKGVPGSEPPTKRLVYRTLSLDDIKLVKNDMGLTINDVVLGITQAGLSCYLNRKYGEATGSRKLKEKNLPKRIRLRATLLVNVRPTTTIEDLAGIMKGDFKGLKDWGNSMGCILLPFHIALRDDPLDYIRDAKATIDRKKQSLEAICTYLIAAFTLKALGRKVGGFVAYRVLSHATMCFSNVVGPLQEISFYGHPMAYLAPSVYGQPQALTIHFQSHVDKMTLVVGVDQDVIPDPHRLCDDIEESLKLAKNAIIERKPIKS